MRKAVTSVVVVGLIAAAVIGASAFARAGTPNDGWQPINGVYAFRQLAYEVPGTDSTYLRSECFATVEPIQQGVVYQTGVVKVYLGAAMACNRDDLRFTDRKWTLTVTSEKAGLVLKQSDATHYYDTPWQAQGGTVSLFRQSLPCRAVTPGPAGRLGWVKAELELTLVDTEGRDWTAVATDYDGVICRSHRK